MDHLYEQLSFFIVSSRFPRRTKACVNIIYISLLAAVGKSDLHNSYFLMDLGLLICLLSVARVNGERDGDKPGKC